jgi:hypothetical protein
MDGGGKARRWWPRTYLPAVPWSTKDLIIKKSFEAQRETMFGNRGRERVETACVGVKLWGANCESGLCVSSWRGAERPI